MNKFFGHLKTVSTHKWWVFYYCCKAGIPFRGLIHDMSKFSPTEFIESVKYWSGTRSPIDACKEDKGISKAWMHHKGRNKHHYEYYIDNLDNGGTALEMPIKDCIELVCDYLGAGKAYYGKNFTYNKELDWWKDKSKKSLLMHPKTKKYITLILTGLADLEKRNVSINTIFNKDVLIELYK